MIRTLISLLCLLPLLGVAFAAEPPDSLPAILDQQRALQADLAADNVGLTSRELGVVRKAQAEVFRLTEGKSSMDQLNIEEKIRLDMALERINTQIKGGDLSHVARGEEDVCKRVQRAGTRMKTTMCMTQAEWDNERRASREVLEKQHVCTPPGCGQ